MPLPPLSEQRRIVARIEALFARTRRARDDIERAELLSDRYAQQVLEHVFDPSAADRILPLETIISDGPQNGYSPPASAESTGTRSLKLTATTSGKLDLPPRAVKRINEVVPPESRFWLRPGDLLVQRANALEHLGASAIYDGPKDAYIYRTS